MTSHKPFCLSNLGLASKYGAATYLLAAGSHMDVFCGYFLSAKLVTFFTNSRTDSKVNPSIVTTDELGEAKN